MEHSVKFSETDFKHEFVEVSSESVMYPKYREKYIEQTQKYIVKALEGKKISCNIDLEKRIIDVATNKSTRDPFIFIKAVNFVKLVSRGVGVEEAMKVLEDEYFCEVIDIKRLASSDKVFEKRRDRLIGPKEMTLKAIQILTKCYVLVHGKTVSIIGSFKGIEEVKKIVIDCMNNIHPMYQIKKLVEKRKLEGDKTKEGEDWSRFLPEIKKSNKKSKKKIVGRPSGGMPSDIPKRKEDIEMETGEYFTDGDFDSGKKENGGEKKKRKKEDAEKYVAPEE
ncbi:putative RNA-binding protein [Encephalitozoon hellem ATCC 50504]|uniref:KRR1 small subunit processome component n=1 Tax=Encephalitozoon hellem TaxID=27973 RepID=A0A9Q9F836_ENCHE|nr:putative RNA-binding protein [Encephalitozoon hellem ATCC 50504]AFM98096.1 putative RNA-binding protein [Encephalitozoon hellem ATCC 50504]UTX42938.1 Krr1 KH1 domain-containing protein [Encephalitozoon hellem]WEL38395.1 Krr1 KH1 domain-containing protein [Encephalitozoon hellem]|eukprot:XP_003887077.1 putative RNA-binding protein [Encephalitozoon hellem ATCC 50504]